MQPTISNTFSYILDKGKVVVTSWSEFQAALAPTRLQKAQWCFRGQANANWHLTPSLERLVGEANRHEIERVERALFSRFRRQAHHYLSSTPADDSVLEWLSLMQHWGTPTRLLDFTLSPFVALYFALVDQIGESPSAVYGVRYTWLQAISSNSLHGTTIKKILPKWGTDEDRDPLAFHKLFDAAFKQRTNLDLVAPVQPFLLNERLAVQQGLFLCPFTLSQNLELTMTGTPGMGLTLDRTNSVVEPEFARKIVIDPMARTEMLWELQRMNITAASLFPGLQGFARSLKESYEALQGDARERDFQISAIDELGWAL